MLRWFRWQNSAGSNTSSHWMMISTFTASIQTPAARPFAELSLAPAFNRWWLCLYKALEEATYRGFTPNDKIRRAESGDHWLMAVQLIEWLL